MKLASILEYEELARNIEHHVQKLLEEHNYDTVGNFLSLYQGFRESGCSNLTEYFQSYSPPITSSHHTCVGLALELWTRLFELNSQFPSLTDHLYLVSCEENIETLSEYCALSDRLDTVAYSLEKEHVLLAFRFEIADRIGVLLCDPGYHIGRVVTVMHDNVYPHTGWFTQSNENNVCKEYHYSIGAVNDKFVEWSTRNTRNGVQEVYTGLIYIARPYMTAVDVTERRNLVYNFRSLLSRDPKGHLLAGIYFKIKENSDEFTIFYQDRGKRRIKLNFAMFKNPETISETTKKSVDMCNDQLNIPENALLSMLTSLSDVSSDKNYIKQLLEINSNINTMAEDN